MLILFDCGVSGLAAWLRGSAPLEAAQPFSSGTLLGALLARGGDALEEFGSRLVVQILGHQLARESMAQDGLAQSLRILHLGVEVGFKVVDNGELIFNA